MRARDNVAQFETRQCACGVRGIRVLVIGRGVLGCIERGGGGILNFLLSKKCWKTDERNENLEQLRLLIWFYGMLNTDIGATVEHPSEFVC